jgi:hypothetical protein
MSVDHNRLINAAARKALGPIGVKRKGTSRVWLDDRGWWTVQVEFQPSSWSRGTYLNVGACWLLYEGMSGAFHVGSRVDVPFVEFREDDSHSFEVAVEAVAKRAKEEVLASRARFPDLDSVAAYYSSLVRRSTWDEYHAGILFALTGRVDDARASLTAVATHATRCDWQRALALRAEDLLALLPHADRFRSCVRGIVLRTRSSGGLPDLHEGLPF